MVGRNELHARRDGRDPAPATRGERETIECGLVLRSIGYKGVPIEGMPFDEKRGVIPNEGGRVVDGAASRSPASTRSAGSSAAPPA